MKYTEIKDEQPEMIECFFAFSNTQFAEGIKKHNLEGKKICNHPGGLYGTREGIEKMMAFYDNQSKCIAEECDPQEVYNYEFGNHECSYTNDDTEAIKIVVAYFGDNVNVKRKFGYVPIDQLNF